MYKLVFNHTDYITRYFKALFGNDTARPLFINEPIILL